MSGIKTRWALRLSKELCGQLTDYAVGGYPNESCGLLLGRGSNGVTHIEQVTSAHNLNVTRARDRYALDPQDHLAAEKRAEAQGLDVVGVWHSHPDHPSVPSRTDLQAAWPEYSYVIVAVYDGRVQGIRSWRLEEGRFIEERLES